MPTIDISLKDLGKLIGKEITLHELEQEALLWVKGEIDGVDDDTIKIDCKESNRPDLWSTEGVARALKPFFTDERGIREYVVKDSEAYIHVDRSVDTVRPYLGAAVVKNVLITDDILKQMIQLQEKVCGTFGRKRKVVSIGLYDYDKITFPVTYKAVKPTEMKFIPLDFDKEMTLKDILAKHPKGTEYSYILKDHDLYPILVDSKGVVLSFPPIINSEASGRVTTKTKNVMVEVTGTNFDDVKVTLNLMTAALADRGGSIENVTVDYGKRKFVLPDFTPKHAKVKFTEIERITGMKLTLREMKDLVEQFGYNVKKAKDSLEVEYPSYRQDILHPIDVIEDILISYGYNSIEPIVPSIATIGNLDPLETYAESIRNLLVGFGAQELLNFTLTNKGVLFTQMNVPEQDIVEIANPVSANWSAIRHSILPSLLEFLSKNVSHEYPQQVYEVGDVVVLDEKEETKVKTIKRVGWALAADDASFTKAKQVLDYVLKGLGFSYEIVPVEHGSFIAGRCGRVVVGGQKVAFIGEVHPKVLENFGIFFPMCAFELNVSELFTLRKS